MKTLQEMEEIVVAEGRFVAHCVSAFVCSLDDVAFWVRQSDAFIQMEQVFAMDGLMYAPTHIQAEEVIKIIINESGNMEKDTIRFIEASRLRVEIGTVIAVARERFVRYNR